MGNTKKKDTPPVDWLLYERTAREEGYSIICGVDEAGRGPLAGPVFAAAVVLHPDTVIEGVNDSKKLTEAKREALFDVICEQAADYSIAAADVAEIESLNILQATYLAMTRAVSGLKQPPQFALIDGNRMPPQLGCAGKTVVKGDGLSCSIAAASILAKVARDRFMLVLHEKYPQYGFDRHKGYGTPQHLEALRQHGPAPIHRLSFLKKIEGIPMPKGDAQ
ncbi:MAG: ribonuclease HII [Ruminococcaceae bacterium]|nr:ribonuclease HII [Oscillospiraceae bacterium]